MEVPRTVCQPGSYRIWLKKPNYARVEMTRPGQKEPGGILVGDGDYFWTYWPEGKFRYPWEQSGKYAEEYEKYQRKFFMKKRTPVGMHSIGHEVFGNLGLMTHPRSKHIPRLHRFAPGIY